MNRFEKGWNLMWDLFLEKAEKESAHDYIVAVKEVCNFGIVRSETIRDTFKWYTRHDETHILNVMELMYALLGEAKDKLTLDEAAMLVMSACCHDIGMSYTEKEKEDAKKDERRIRGYLDKNEKDYLLAHPDNIDVTKWDDAELELRYLRSIHHERIQDLLDKKFKNNWPEPLQGRISKKALINVCRSHGQDLKDVELKADLQLDQGFCAVLLRLADIMDFDQSRAPKALYQYSFLDSPCTFDKLFSKAEWDKHGASHGFQFRKVKEEDRKYFYSLPYSATCKSMQVEAAIRSYINWVNEELKNCKMKSRDFDDRWRSFVFPGEIKCEIEAEGYESGEFRLNMDQEKVLDLLSGLDLYADSTVFVRELLQNAIDAVRTRGRLDRNSGWTPKIRIKCWEDAERYSWFRIEDNGIGMTEEVIKKYFLKIGRSYYTSDEFEKEKRQCGVKDYMPISRFGIGILSCFLGNRQDTIVEVSSKHYQMKESALCLKMIGRSGYYNLVLQDNCQWPEGLQEVAIENEPPYRREPGTVVAVRTNLYQRETCTSVKEIVDKFVMCPDVSIEIEEDEERYSYPTEEEFMKNVNAFKPSDDLDQDGVLKMSMPDELLSDLKSKFPFIYFEENQNLQLKMVKLNKYTESKCLSGVIITVANNQAVKGEVRLGKESISLDKIFRLTVDWREDYVSVRVAPFNLFGNSGSFRTKIGEICGRAHTLLENNEWKLEGEESEWWKDYIRKYKDDSEIEEDFGKTECDRYLLESLKDYVGFMEFVGVYKMKNWKDILVENKIIERSEMPKMLNGIMLISHNGIICKKYELDDPKIFNEVWGASKEIVGGICLLKDRYRPNLSVSRDEKCSFPLELSCDIGLIAKQANLIDINLKGFMASDEGMERKAYCELLNNRPDFLARMVFVTKYGRLGTEELERKTNKGEEVEIMIDDSFSESASGRLLLAYLQCTYTCKFDLKREGVIIVAKKFKTGNLPEGEEYFPPSVFFVEMMNNKMNCFTYEIKRFSEVKHYVLGCNKNHWLSQFLCNNAVNLKENARGIFCDMVKVLTQSEDSDQIKDGINRDLQKLRRRKGYPFHIDDCLLLTEDDFYKNYCVDKTDMI